MVGAGAGIVVGVVGLALRATGLRSFNDGANGCWVDPRDGDVWAERAGALSTCNGAANQVADGGTLAAVGFTVGGVLATASMALWLAAPTQRGERSGRSAGLRCGAGPGALGLTCGVGF
jgi:hypothetical protein